MIKRYPQFGTERIRRRFAWFPVRFDNYCIWLRYFYVKERWTNHFGARNKWQGDWITTEYFLTNPGLKNFLT